MKKILLFASLFFIVGNHVSAQIENAPTYEFTPEEYQHLKETGKIPAGNVKIVLAEPKNDAPIHGSINASGHDPVPQDRSASCGCYVAPDASYTLAMSPNDDGSTASIAIPFTFCLYGDNYTSLYINNNGNVSFGTSYGTFSASAFPSASYVMVAPFWGDVDTRGTGSVYYKITPTAIYINWVAVGYFSQHTDKTNTFQLILSDGNDPFIGVGNNVAFCYEDMQWTTGDASSGSNGFGGIPATVGSNRGNGIDFVQFGQFDQAGNTYDGPFGNPDGIDWLDYATFKFNTCVSGSNVAPILASVTPSSSNGSGSGVACGDTLQICGTSDTLILSATFIAPEAGQTITFTVNAPTLSNFQVLSTANGTVDMMVVSSPADAGFNQIDITATDNGTPAMSTTFPLTIYIDTAGLSAFQPSIIGPDTVCANNIPVTLSTQVYDSYQWSTGSTAPTASVSNSDTTWLTVGLNGCFKTTSHVLTILPQPTPAILGNTSYCVNDGGTNLGANASYTSYNWTQGATSVGTDSTEFLAAGTYTLTVTNNFGCTGTATATVSVINPTVSINLNGTNPFCQGDSLTLIANGSSGVTYSWNTGQSISTITVDTAGLYIVNATLGSCAISDSVLVTVTPRPSVNVSGPNSLCSGTTANLIATTNATNPTFSWTGGGTNDTLNINTGGTYIVTVDDGGCSVSDTIVVQLIQTPVGTITGNTAFCPGDSAVLTANFSSATGYLWNTGETTSSITVTSGGVYYVVATNSGCSGTDTTFVTAYAQPNADFTTNPVSPFLFGTTASINDATSIAAPDSVVSWTWLIDGNLVSSDADFSYLFPLAGDYPVTLYVMSNNGCVDTITKIISVIAEITIPNVFSPGTSPGANDMFVIQNLEYYPNSSLSIFNRWGEVVYESSDYQNNWDGKHKGNNKIVPSGTYFYILTLNDGTTHNGTVTVFGEK